MDSPESTAFRYSNSNSIRTSASGTYSNSNTDRITPIAFMPNATSMPTAQCNFQNQRTVIDSDQYVEGFNQIPSQKQSNFERYFQLNSPSHNQSQVVQTDMQYISGSSLLYSRPERLQGRSDIQPEISNNIPPLPNFENPLSRTSQNPFPFHGVEDWMNTNYLLSIINKQAQQLQAAAYHYQQTMDPSEERQFTRKDFGPNMVNTNYLGNAFLPTGSSPHMQQPSTDLYRPEYHQPILQNLGTGQHIPQMNSHLDNASCSLHCHRSRLNNNAYQHLNSTQMDRNIFPNSSATSMYFPQQKLRRRRKASETYIPASNGNSNLNGDITPEITSESGILDNLHQNYRKQISPKKKYTKHNKMDRLVSLSDYTDDSSSNCDYTNSCISKPYSKIPKKSPKLIEEFPKTSSRIKGKENGKKFRKFAKIKKESKHAKKQSTVNCQYVARRQMGGTRRRGRILHKLYTPPSRIAHIHYQRRILPFRHRWAPVRFSTMVNWNTLLLRTIYEKNSKYKHIQVLKKTDVRRTYIRSILGKKNNESASHQQTFGSCDAQNNHTSSTSYTSKFSPYEKKRSVTSEDKGCRHRMMPQRFLQVMKLRCSAKHRRQLSSTSRKIAHFYGTKFLNLPSTPRKCYMQLRPISRETTESTKSVTTYTNTEEDKKGPLNCCQVEENGCNDMSICSNHPDELAAHPVELHRDQHHLGKMLNRITESNATNSYSMKETEDASEMKAQNIRYEVQSAHNSEDRLDGSIYDLQSYDKEELNMAENTSTQDAENRMKDMEFPVSQFSSTKDQQQFQVRNNEDGELQTQGNNMTNDVQEIYEESEVEILPSTYTDSEGCFEGTQSKHVMIQMSKNRKPQSNLIQRKWLTNNSVSISDSSKNIAYGNLTSPVEAKGDQLELKGELNSFNDPNANTHVKMPNGTTWKIVKYVPPKVKRQYLSEGFTKSAETERQLSESEIPTKKKYTFARSAQTSRKNEETNSKWMSQEDTKAGGERSKVYKFTYLNSFKEIIEEKKWRSESRAKIFGEDSPNKSQIEAECKSLEVNH